MDLLTLLILNKMKNKKGDVTPTGTINITENGETDVTNYAIANVNVPSDRAIFPSSMSFSGANFANVDISWIENADTSKLENADGIFGSIGTNATFPSSFSFKKWNTILLNSLGTAFYYNKYIETIDMSSMNFPSLTNIKAFCSSASAFRTINLSGSTFPVLGNMSQMFYSCNQMTNVNLTNTVINGVTDISDCFYNCGNVSSIDLTCIKPSNAGIYCAEMVRGCTKIETIDIHTFTNKITNLKSAFNSCSNLKIIIFGENFSLENLSGAQAFLNTFSYCPLLTNDTLNEILKVISTATSYTGTKTLSLIGLSNTQIATCQTLSNWPLAQSAGWTTGI